MKQSRDRAHYITPVFEYAPDLDHVTYLASFDPLPDNEPWECAVAARENKNSWSIFRYSRPARPDADWEIEIERVPYKFDSWDMYEALKGWIDTDIVTEEVMQDPHWYYNYKGPLVLKARHTPSPEPTADLILQRGFNPRAFPQANFAFDIGPEPTNSRLSVKKQALLLPHYNAKLKSEWDAALEKGIFVTKSYRNAGQVDSLGNMRFPTIENAANFTAAIGLQIKGGQIELTRFFRENCSAGEWQTQTLKAGDQGHLVTLLDFMRQWSRAAQSCGTGRIENDLLPEGRLINPNTPFPAA